MCANKIPGRSFPGPTWRSGKEIQPDGRYCRQNPCGWLGSARGGNGRFDTAASNPAPSSAERSHQAGGCDCRAKTSFIHDLFYPFYRRLEFCMLLNSGYIAFLLLAEPCISNAVASDECGDSWRASICFDCLQHLLSLSRMRVRFQGSSRVHRTSEIRLA